MSRTDAKARFMGYVTPEPTSGCWLWTGHLNASGYGKFRLNGRQQKAHRAAYVLFVGPIPKKDGHHVVCVCHRCDVRSCVNPAHLFLGTNAENSRDMAEKGRVRHGDGHVCAKLTAADVLSIRTATSVSNAELARRFGVSRSTASRARAGVSWRREVSP
jgi:hypothetical protein